MSGTACLIQLLMPALLMHLQHLLPIVLFGLTTTKLNKFYYSI